MSQTLIMLGLSPFGATFNWEGWWFQYFMSWLRVWLSEEGAKNVPWPWLSLLWGWGGLTMTVTGKFVYMAHHFILLRLNLFCLKVDSLWLSGEGAKSVSWSGLSPPWRWGSVTITFTGNFVHMGVHIIMLWFNPFEIRFDREGWWFDHPVP